MATWQVIEFTGHTLVSVIKRHADQLMGTSSNVDVQLATATTFDKYALTDKPTITVFLYRVMEVPEMRNGTQRVLPDGRLARQPLPLELCYMITPWGVRSDNNLTTDETAAEEEHRLMGVILQALYDRAELSNADLVDNSAAPVWSAFDSLQVVLDSLPIDDQYRIWDSNDLAYRLSLAYRVRVLGLEPSQAVGAGRVIEARFNTQGV
jgi:hypothetical protein